jgi:hypothetical protein
MMKENLPGMLELCLETLVAWKKSAESDGAPPSHGGALNRRVQDSQAEDSGTSTDTVSSLAYPATSGASIAVFCPGCRGIREDLEIKKS